MKKLVLGIIAVIAAVSLFILYILLWRGPIWNVRDVARFFFAIVLPKENAQNWMSSSVLQQVKCEVPCHSVGQMPHFFCIIS